MSQTPQQDEDFGGRPGELTVELPARFDAGLYFIGTIRTPWKSRADCPKNPREAKGAPCTIDVDPRYGAALAGIEAFAQIVVIYYMDRARRDLVVQLPRHLNIPRGTFSLALSGAAEPDCAVGRPAPEGRGKPAARCRSRLSRRHAPG